jgi:hypothetical protein
MVHLLQAMLKIFNAKTQRRKGARGIENLGGLFWASLFAEGQLPCVVLLIFLHPLGVFAPLR